MKILVIRSTSDVSGTEIYTIRLFGELIKTPNIRIHILTNNREFLRKLSSKHIPASFHPLPLKEIGTKRELLAGVVRFLPTVVSYLITIHRLETDGRFDVVVLQSTTEKLFLSGFLKAMGYQVVWIEHGPVFGTTRSGIVKWLYALTSRWANRIITVSEHANRDLIRGTIPAAKLSTIYIGVNDNITGKKPFAGKNNAVIGYIGNFSREKGVENFVQIAKRLADRFPSVTFLMLGRGPLLQSIRKEIRDVGLAKRILCPGFVENVAPYIKRMNIFLFPTFHTEGISIALLEAASHGILPVVRDVGGNNEVVINGKTGYLFTTDEEAVRILGELLDGRRKSAGIQKAMAEHLHNRFRMQTQIPAFISVMTAPM